MGYQYDSHALERMSTMLREAAKDLADSTKNPPPSPDAGDVSALTAQVISGLLQSGAAIVAKQESIASKIHASKGSYDDIENTNDGLLRRNMDGLSDYTHSNQWMGY